MADDINELVRWVIGKARKLDPNRPEQDSLRVSMLDHAADVLLARKAKRREKAIKRLIRVAE